MFTDITLKKSNHFIKKKNQSEEYHTIIVITGFCTLLILKFNLKLHLYTFYLVDLGKETVEKS